MVFAKAPARIGLLGNPSDMYGGKCISFTFDRYANVSVRESSQLLIKGNGLEQKTLEYNGHSDLVKATIKKLGLQDKSLEVEYVSNVPKGVGLAGSSAIVIATIKACNKLYNTYMGNAELAELALHVESDELGIASGFQDRYAIAFGGMSFMDFAGKEYQHANDHFGIVKKLPVEEIPCFLCTGDYRKDSATVHNPLRARFLEGEKGIKEHMDLIGDLAEEGILPLVTRDWRTLGSIMNRNTDLREEICPHLPSDKEMMKKALDCGAFGAKVAGSGGSIVVLTQNGEVYKRLAEEYTCFTPKIVE